MVKSMASVKVTITVPEKQLAAIRKRVAAGEAASVSRYFQSSVSRALADDRAFRELLKEDLAATGGPMTKEEKEWADALLTPQRPRTKTRGQKKVA